MQACTRKTLSRGLAESRFPRLIPVNGSDFEPKEMPEEVMERKIVRFSENKGGTAYNTPFANN